MTTENERVMSYESLSREYMRQGFPSEWFILPKRPIDLLRTADQDTDPYERWLKGQASGRMTE